MIQMKRAYCQKYYHLSCPDKYSDLVQIYKAISQKIFFQNWIPFIMRLLKTKN